MTSSNPADELPELSVFQKRKHSLRYFQHFYHKFVDSEPLEQFAGVIKQLIDDIRKYNFALVEDDEHYDDNLVNEFQQQAHSLVKYLQKNGSWPVSSPSFPMMAGNDEQSPPIRQATTIFQSNNHFKSKLTHESKSRTDNELKFKPSAMFANLRTPTFANSSKPNIIAKGNRFNRALQSKENEIIWDKSNKPRTNSPYKDDVDNVPMAGKLMEGQPWTQRLANDLSLHNYDTIKEIETKHNFDDPCHSKSSPPNVIEQKKHFHLITDDGILSLSFIISDIDGAYLLKDKVDKLGIEYLTLNNLSQKISQEYDLVGFVKLSTVIGLFKMEVKYQVIVPHNAVTDTPDAMFSKNILARFSIPIPNLYDLGLGSLPPLRQVITKIDDLLATKRQMLLFGGGDGGIEIETETLLVQPLKGENPDAIFKKMLESQFLIQQHSSPELDDHLQIELTDITITNDMAIYVNPKLQLSCDPQHAKKILLGQQFERTLMVSVQGPQEKQRTMLIRPIPSLFYFLLDPDDDNLGRFLSIMAKK